MVTEETTPYAVVRQPTGSSVGITTICSLALTSNKPASATGARLPQTATIALKAGNGDDTVIGASGADTLRGGPGADTIIEGPVNDATQDTIEADPTVFSGGPPPDADTWNDKINVASTPAHKDIVNCGPGTDEVEADPLDVVNSNCETVEIVDPSIGVASPSAGEAAAADEGAAAPPKAMSTEAFPQEAADPMVPDDGNTTPPPTTGGASPARAAGFGCWAAPIYRGATWCARAYLDHADGWGLGLNGTYPRRWIAYRADYPFIRDVSGLLHPVWNEYDEVDDYSSTALDPDIYMKTSCLSNCWKWTWVSGYKWYF